MLLRIVFSIITLALAGYGLYTRDYQFQGYMTLFLGLTFLTMGIQEIQQRKKVMGWLLVMLFAFALFSSIQGFLLL